jgi:hypothetical protein
LARSLSCRVAGIQPKSQNPVDVASETMGKMATPLMTCNLADRYVSTGEIN